MASGTIPIILDRERRLRWGVNAMEASEKLFKPGRIEEIFREGRMSIGEMRNLLWAMLEWDDSRLTVYHVGDLMESALLAEPQFYENTIEKFYQALLASRLYKRAEPGNALPEAAAPLTSGNGSSTHAATPLERSA